MATKQKDGYRTFTVELPEKWIEAVKKLAAANEQKIGPYIRLVLKRHLARKRVVNPSPTAARGQHD